MKKLEDLKGYATPAVGMGGGFGAYLLKFIEISTPILEYVALLLGVSIAFFALGVQIKKYRNTKWKI